MSSEEGVKTDVIAKQTAVLQQVSFFLLIFEKLIKYVQSFTTICRGNNFVFTKLEK